MNRSMTLLDETGDTTVTWDEDTDERMLKIIEEKMKQGFQFFIVKPIPVVKIKRYVKAKSIDEVREAGSVMIRDEALNDLFLTGAIGTAKSPVNDNIVPEKVAKTAREVVANHSVAVRPARGG